MVVHSAYPNDVRVAREVRVALREGYEVDVIALREEGEPKEELLDGVRVSRLPFSHRRGVGVVGVLWEYVGFAASASLKVAARMLRRRYDIVQIHNPPDFLIAAAVVPRLLGSQVILDIHDLSPDMFAMRFEGRPGAAFADRALRFIERWATHFANVVITVHDPYARELIARGLPSAKTAVIMNSLDELLLPKTPRTPRDDCFRIVYHGTVTPSYGVQLLVEAAADLVHEIPNLTLEIYGEGDSLRDIRARAAELGIHGNLILSGKYLPQLEVLQRVQAAHVGVVPNFASRLNRFALSSKMLEYVALGVPVVSADLPTIREHFSEDEVLFFPAGDAQALAQTLRSVARDPEAAQVRATAALRRYRESYGWSANAARYASVLADARDGKEPSQRVGATASRVDHEPLAGQPTDVVFETADDILLFEHFRVPHRRVVPQGDWFENLPHAHPLRSCAQIRAADAGRRSRALYWPRFAEHTSPELSRYEIASIPIYCRVLPERAVVDLTEGAPGSWRPAEPIRDARGRQVSAVWRDDEGSALLPFDPSEVITNYWSERYLLAKGSHLGGRQLKQLALRSYYLLRPVVPRTSQLRFRRMISAFQLRSALPRWPIETALDDFYELMFGYLVDLARAPVPWISPWPEPYSWAFVLTHDVEASVGYERIGVLRDLEAAYGFRSSWNLVPMRYTVDDGVISELTAQGFEVGVHGLYHDGRDFASHTLFKERLREVSRYATRWNARGFRSPSTHRVWDWMSELGFDYDSSYPDTDPFEPFPGGCCSLLPYFNKDLVELPITLPQDHTLYMILGHVDASLWVQKSNYIKERGAMALVITHPDYIHEPRIPAAYESLLRAIQNDGTAWRALPAEVSAWWRRRAASYLEPSDGGWRVHGPAAQEAQIRFTGNEVRQRERLRG